MKTSRYFLVSGENENGKGKDSIYTTQIPVISHISFKWFTIDFYKKYRILMFINNLILITLLVVVHVSMEEKAIFL